MRRLRVVILGAGFGGRAVMAWLARRVPPARCQVTLVSPNRLLPYRPDLVFSASRPPGFVVRLQIDVARIARRLGMRFVEDMAVAVDAERHRVRLLSGSVLDYDVLFWATGAKAEWDAFPGATSALGLLCQDYGARVLAMHAETWQGGRLVLVEGPLLADPTTKPALFSACPTPLYEWLFLFLDRLRPQVRSRTEIVLVTEAPYVGEVLGPKARAYLVSRLAEADVQTVTAVRLQAVEGRRLHYADAAGRPRELGGDVLLWSPPYGGSPLARASELDDGYGWLPTDADLRHPQHPDIYVVGDVGRSTLPKIGHTAMVQARLAVEHWWATVRDLEPRAPDAPKLLLVLHVGRGEGILNVHDTLYGGSHEWTFVGRLPAAAKQCFGWAYRRFGGLLPILP